MKTLIITFISLSILLLSSNLSAQQTGRIENGFNVESFPKVSFIYHSYNPELFNDSNFWYLKEAGTKRDFNVKHLPIGNSSEPQTTLILWEDMAHNGNEQYRFTQKVIVGFFNNADIPEKDKFSVSVFNRRKNEKSALTNITNGFTNDKSQIITAVNNRKHSTEYYTEFPNRSDMYTAIREGLEQLAPFKGVKSIIVFTSGYSMKNSGSDSESQVLLKAQQLHIPVYIFQYYYKSGVAPESEGFAKSTFGTFNSYKNIDTAEADLIALYPEISKRYQGHRYEITFTSKDKRGAEARMINLSVNGEEIQEQLLPPYYTIGAWIKDYPWWFALILLILMAIAVTILIFIRKAHKKTLENQRGLEELEQRRIRDKKDAEIYQRELEKRKHKEQEEHKRKQQEEEAERLMRIKNLYPRLKCEVGSEMFTYMIQTSHTKIGRDADNDVVMKNETVSRHHAEIVFTGGGFDIIDRGSTNKVILNGQFVERASLKSGDVIGLGEAVIIFTI
jgi:hypothetical protein